MTSDTTHDGAGQHAKDLPNCRDDIAAGRQKCVRTKRQAAWPLAVAAHVPASRTVWSIAPTQRGRGPVFQARFHPHAITQKGHEIRLGSGPRQASRCRGALRMQDDPSLAIILVGVQSPSRQPFRRPDPANRPRVRSARRSRSTLHSHWRCLSACRSSRPASGSATWQSRHASPSFVRRDGNRRHRAIVACTAASRIRVFRSRSGAMRPGLHSLICTTDGHGGDGAASARLPPWAPRR